MIATKDTPEFKIVRDACNLCLAGNGMSDGDVAAVVEALHRAHLLAPPLDYLGNVQQTVPELIDDLAKSKMVLGVLQGSRLAPYAAKVGKVLRSLNEVVRAAEFKKSQEPCEHDFVARLDGALVCGKCAEHKG